MIDRIAATTPPMPMIFQVCEAGDGEADHDGGADRDRRALGDESAGVFVERLDILVAQARRLIARAFGTGRRRVVVGLGNATHVARVHVVWPDGKNEEWNDVPVDRYTTLQQGTGK